MRILNVGPFGLVPPMRASRKSSLAGQIDSIQVCLGGIIGISFLDPQSIKADEEAAFISFRDVFYGAPYASKLFFWGSFSTFCFPCMTSVETHTLNCQLQALYPYLSNLP